MKFQSRRIKLIKALLACCCQKMKQLRVKRFIASRFNARKSLSLHPRNCKQIYCLWLAALYFIINPNATQIKKSPSVLFMSDCWIRRKTWATFRWMKQPKPTTIARNFRCKTYKIFSVLIEFKSMAFSTEIAENLRVLRKFSKANECKKKRKKHLKTFFPD